MPPCEDFDPFFAEEFPSVVAFLYAVSYGQAGNSLVQDSVAEAFLKAYERWETGTLSNPRAWVRTVAKRELSDAILRNLDGVRRAVDGGWLPPEYVHDSTSIVDAALYQQELLKTLPERQREVMAWHIDGFTPQEIADELGISPETVRSNLRHARAKLQRIYEQDRLRSRGHEGGA